MSDRLPREVWIATITQTDRQAETWQGMVELFLERMQGFVPMEPDIYCLPEAFPFVNLTAGRPPGVEVAEVPPGPTTALFAEFAERHNCYVVCPTYTRDGEGRCYNAAVVIGRRGQVGGEYARCISP